MSYAVAAYVLVIGGLLAYGLWVDAQRRAHIRRDGERDGPPSGGTRNA